MSPTDLQVLWDAWFAYAPPDAQVALDAGKLRGESWALREYPPYVKPWNHSDDSGIYYYTNHYGYHKLTQPVAPEEAEYYAQSPQAHFQGTYSYQSWKDAILGREPK